MKHPLDQRTPAELRRLALRADCLSYQAKTSGATICLIRLTWTLIELARATRYRSQLELPLAK